VGFLYEHSANLVRKLYDSRIEGPPILDATEHFPDAMRFAAAWHTIRDEAMAMAPQVRTIPRFHDIMPEQTNISANDGRDWRMFILKAYGVENPRHMSVCPALAAIIAESPDVLSASLSFMEPGKHVPAHRGPFRGVIRFYLGLSVPKFRDGRVATLLKIAGEEYRIGEGQWLLWDDTYFHEVWNHGDTWRAVLLLDVWRRTMPLDMRLLSRAVIAAVGAGVWLRGTD
jgi:aspartate beta-hydroxylase